jgi:hypothetical protein
MAGSSESRPVVVLFVLEPPEELVLVLDEQPPQPARPNVTPNKINHEQSRDPRKERAAWPFEKTANMRHPDH